MNLLRSNLFGQMGTTAVVALILLVPVRAASSEDSAQLRALNEAASVCIDTTVMPDDWDTRLTGWTSEAPTPRLKESYAAYDTFAGFAMDGEGLGDLSLMGKLELHTDLTLDFEEVLSYSEELINDGVLRFFSHPSGWTLILDVEAQKPAHSVCIFALDDPEPDVVNRLSQSYWGAGQNDLMTGRFSMMETKATDGKEFAPLEVLTFVTASDMVQTQGLPDMHPAHFASDIYVEFYLSAFSREG